MNSTDEIARRNRGPRLGRSLPRCIAVALAVALGGGALGAPVAQAEDAPSAIGGGPRVDDKAPAYRVDDVTQVYVGNPRLFKKPCVVSTDRVYRSIPEYQEIVDKNLTDKDVRYHFLMRKASDKFSRAVQALARDQGYDLVAAKGSVSATSAESPTIPDGTDGAISRLPS